MVEVVVVVVGTLAALVVLDATPWAAPAARPGLPGLTDADADAQIAAVFASSCTHVLVTARPFSPGDGTGLERGVLFLRVRFLPHSSGSGCSVCHSAPCSVRSQA